MDPELEALADNLKLNSIDISGQTNWANLYLYLMIKRFMEYGNVFVFLPL